MATCTLIDCFLKINQSDISDPLKLPKYVAAPVADKATASISGVSTSEMDAPSVACAKSVQDWVDSAVSALGNLPRRHTLSKQVLPYREDAMYHITEGDVVRSAALHLIHPVNQALTSFAATSATITCRSECVPKGEHMKVRADIAFFLAPRGPGEQQQRAFAVLEAKNRGVILKPEFDRAQVKPSETVDKALSRARKRQYKTLYEGNSLTLMKQAAAYAIALGVQYVALFNWDYLVLVKFTSLDVAPIGLQRAINGVGDICRTTIISNEGSSHKMRAALLGFLIEAYEDSTRAGL